MNEAYEPSPHPSHLACAPPNNSNPPPAIIAAISAGDRLIASTIFRISVRHDFGADYSDRFRPTARDYTVCPCEHISRNNPAWKPRKYRHTTQHAIFRCALTRDARKISTRDTLPPRRPSVTHPNSPPMQIPIRNPVLHPPPPPCAPGRPALIALTELTK
jgi:hypothetical protein